MAAAGFTWVRAQLPERLVKKAREHKADQSWDDYIAKLIAADVQLTVAGASK